MKNSDISELLVFLAVARHRSFRQAAIDRGMTKSAVSHAIRRLETDLNLRLFNRTTRSVSLTEPGAQLFSALEPAFSDIRRALETLNQFRETPFGKVRLNVPSSIAAELLGKVIGPLLERNPGLQFEVVATDHLVDIVKEGFDAGFRLEELLSQDMIAVRLNSTLRFAVVASPTYAARHGLPSEPQELTGHQCIRYKLPSGVMYPWEFKKEGQSLKIEVEGPATFDNQDLMLEAAITGVGLAYVWDYRARRPIEEGLLVRCLDDWCPVRNDLFLYYPSKKNLSAGLRVLIDALKAGH